MSCTYISFQKSWGRYVDNMESKFFFLNDVTRRLLCKSCKFREWYSVAISFEEHVNVIFKVTRSLCYCLLCRIVAWKGKNVIIYRGYRLYSYYYHHYYDHISLLSFFRDSVLNVSDCIVASHVVSVLRVSFHLPLASLYMLATSIFCRNHLFFLYLEQKWRNTGTHHDRNYPIVQVKYLFSEAILGWE